MQLFYFDGHFGNFQFGTIENKTPRIALSISFGEYVHISFECIDWNGILRS